MEQAQEALKKLNVFAQNANLLWLYGRQRRSETGLSGLD